MVNPRHTGQKRHFYSIGVILVRAVLNAAVYAGLPTSLALALTPAVVQLLGLATAVLLVAGAADTGLMALMLQAAEPGTRVTVIDRCRTPLALVDELAARLGAPVETQLATLQDFERPGGYDLVFGHSVFGHIRHPDQPPAMRNLFRCLRPGGRLLLVFRDKMAGDAGVTNDARSVAGWWDWIKAKVEEWEAAGNRLPDDREGFMALLRRYAGTRADRHPGGRPADQFRSLVEDAGFEIERLAPLPRSKVWEAGGGVAEAGRPGFALLARRPPAD